jgi:hypothetical protein
MRWPIISLSKNRRPVDKESSGNWQTHAGLSLQIQSNLRFAGNPLGKTANATNGNSQWLQSVSSNQAVGGRLIYAGVLAPASPALPTAEPSEQLASPALESEAPGGDGRAIGQGLTEDQRTAQWLKPFLLKIGRLQAVALSRRAIRSPVSLIACRRPTRPRKACRRQWYLWWSGLQSCRHLRQRNGQSPCTSRPSLSGHQ